MDTWTIIHIQPPIDNAIVFRKATEGDIPQVMSLI